MKTKIYVEDVLNGLNELSSKKLQERLWLSDGPNGDVSSFDEAICRIFDDGGVTRAMESQALPANLLSIFERLNTLIDKVPNNIHPKNIIEDPGLREIGTVAKSILEEFSASK